MNDLTEKLKELLMRIGVVHEHYFHDGDAAAIAKQLAPEIEKLMPRWIPVSELLPEDGQWIYVWEECANALVHYRGQKYLFFTFTHWMPIPKVPTK